MGARVSTDECGVTRLSSLHLRLVTAAVRCLGLRLSAYDWTWTRETSPSTLAPTEPRRCNRETVCKNLVVSNKCINDLRPVREPACLERWINEGRSDAWVEGESCAVLKCLRLGQMYVRGCL